MPNEMIIGANNNEDRQQGSTLKKFFIDSLKKMKWSEEAIISGLQKMQTAATNRKLKEAFLLHEHETRQHLSRIENVFELLEIPSQGTRCKVLDAMLTESDMIVDTTPEGSFTRDTALIIGAQKIEHHEIASYGGLVALAQSLELFDVATLLETNLNEEKETDKKLTALAESSINLEAAEEAD